MRSNGLALGALIGAFLLLAAPASAQTVDEGPDPATIRVRFGPLWMNPSIALPNLGVDTNVFNEPPSASPKTDFTMTVVPKADLWLRMGRTWLSGTIAEDVVWYQQYETERSTNHLLAVVWKAPLNRLATSVGASWLSTSARPGFEIDARVRRREPAVTASVEVRGFPKTFFGARAAGRDVSYEKYVYLGTNLQEELDRTVTDGAITIRHELTPLNDNDQPYYVLTGTGGSIAQRIAGPVDVVARASDQRLRYQNRLDDGPADPERTDRVRSFGTGVGVRIGGGDLRLGFNIDRERRTSVLPEHEYEGLKYGTSLTYGL
ncbi:MAG TPA: hypothetical protein VM818_09410 [Vicinamibacterales bacterium]|jgi:hypothetical protein|nr:hypothetical protein [Vicinamibacterales bacterium]